MTQIKKLEQKTKYRILVGSVVVTLLAGSLLWYGTRKNAYALSIDGKVVAIIKEKDQVNMAYEELVNELKTKAGVDIAVNETLEIEPVHSKVSEINTYDELAKVLSSEISYDIQAYEILVNGESYAVIDSEKTAASILQEIAKEYLPKSGEVTLQVDEVASQEEQTDLTNELSSEGKEEGVMLETTIETVEVAEALPQDEVTRKITVGDVAISDQEENDEQEETEGQKIIRELTGLDFNEEITMRTTYVNAEAVLTEEEAKEQLLGNKYEVIDYELQEGDNTWNIAMKYGTTMEQILEMNPEIEDETKMQIGSVIKVNKSSPILSISTVETSTFKEIIPAEIEYVVFSDLYEGETKVYQEGNDGLKELTVEVTKVNGKEVSRKLLAEKNISEAKTKVIAYGTKKKPVTPPSTSTNGSNNNSNSNSNTTNNSNSSSGNSNHNNDYSSSGTFIHPLKGAGRVSSGYGSRWGSFHKGIDFAAPAGTPVYASAAGKVIYSGYNSGGYGKLIIIDHNNGYQTYYAHNSSLYVNVGANVSQGQNIAGVGTTGNSTGNHLHFEIRKNGTPVNPSSYLF